MRTIDVESSPPKNHRPSAAEPSATSSAKSAAVAESSALLPRVVEALLHFVSAHRVERIGSVARNRHGFRRAVRSDPRHRHPRRHDVAHRTTARILSSLRNRKTLKPAPAAMRPLLLIFAAGTPRVIPGRIAMSLVVADFVWHLARPRLQNQFKVLLHILMRWVERYILRVSRKRRHLHAYAILPIGGNPQHVTAIHIRPRVDLFVGRRIRRGNSCAGNRHVSRFPHAVNTSQHGGRGGSLLCGLCP